MHAYLKLRAQITTGGEPSDCPVMVQDTNGKWEIVFKGWWGGWGVRELATFKNWGNKPFCIYGNAENNKPVLCHNMRELLDEAETLARGGLAAELGAML